MFATLHSLFTPWLVFLSEDPALRLLQLGMLFLGAAVIFLVFFTTRDILLRTHSFFYMFFSIVLVAILPVIGFLLYLLIRPARTIKQREMEELLVALVDGNRSPAQVQATAKKKPPAKKTKKKSSPKENLSL